MSGASRAEEMAAAWNWCAHCEQLVDADDVHDGSDVRCLGCARRFVVVSYTDGSWGLDDWGPPSFEDSGDGDGEEDAP